MRQMDKTMHKVTTERIVGFGAAVRSLGKHEQCGAMVYYSPEHIRLVLQGKQRSLKLLKVIAEKCPMMFDICRVCDEVQAWWADYRVKNDAEQNGKAVA